MLGFSIHAYTLPEENWIDSLSTVDILDREPLIYLETGLNTPFPASDAHFGLYRFFRQGGYPNEMVTSFAYLKQCIDSYTPAEWRPFHKHSAWNTMKPSALVIIEEWDQS